MSCVSPGGDFFYGSIIEAVNRIVNKSSVTLYINDNHLDEYPSFTIILYIVYAYKCTLQSFEHPDSYCEIEHESYPGLFQRAFENFLYALDAIFQRIAMDEQLFCCVLQFAIRLKIDL